MELTQEYIKSLFNYIDGKLYWRVSRTKSIKIGGLAGHIKPKNRKDKNTEYRVVIKLDNKQRYAARLIFLYHHGYLPEIVDHINRNCLDDRIENLRAATISGNAQNRTSKRNGTSQYLGVSWTANRGRWYVHIKTKEKNFYGGSFADEKQAALRYNELAIIHHGEFASLNIID